MREKLDNSVNRASGIPRRYWGLYLDEITPLNDEQKRYISKLMEVLRGKWWSLVVLGTVGNGKTMLASGALSLWNMGHPYGGLYVTQEQLVDECRSAFAEGSKVSERDVLSKYMDTGLLIVDELTVRNWTDYTKNLIQKVFSYRHGQNLRTIPIGNLDVETFKGMFDEHIISRFREGETQIMSAEDMRVHGDF